jgi:hypothetical protein
MDLDSRSRGDRLVGVVAIIPAAIVLVLGERLSIA